MVGGADFSLDEQNSQPIAGATPEEDAGSARPSQRQQKTSLRHAEGLHEDTDKIVFDEIALDEASDKAIEGLADDEEVVVLMPAKEFVIAHGPKRTVLYWLCRNVGMAITINDTLEGGSRNSRYYRPCSVSLDYAEIQLPVPAHSSRRQGSVCIPHALWWAFSIGHDGDGRVGAI